MILKKILQIGPAKMKKLIISFKKYNKKINNYYDIIVELIPYDQFNDIKKIGKGDFTIVYSAVWTDGPLYCYNDRISRELVALKCLDNSQNITNEFLNEV